MKTYENHSERASVKVNQGSECWLVAEADAVRATTRAADGVRRYLSESPREHMEKINKESATVGHGAQGLMHDVLGSVCKETATLNKGTEALSRYAKSTLEHFPLNSTLATVGAVGAVGCTAIAVTAAAPEVIGLSGAAAVGFGGVAVYNGALPFIKTAQKNLQESADRAYQTALGGRPQW